MSKTASGQFSHDKNVRKEMVRMNDLIDKAGRAN